MEGKRPRILCVEKQKDICKLISGALPGYEFTFTTNVSDGFELARKDKFDLILIDCDLMYTNCGRASFIIRSFDKLTPILFITKESDLTEETALAVDAQGIVRKDDPGFLDDLKRRVREFHKLSGD